MTNTKTGILENVVTYLMVIVFVLVVFALGVVGNNNLPSTVRYADVNLKSDASTATRWAVWAQFKMGKVTAKVTKLGFLGLADVKIGHAGRPVARILLVAVPGGKWSKVCDLPLPSAGTTRPASPAATL